MSEEYQFQMMKIAFVEYLKNRKVYYIVAKEAAISYLDGRTYYRWHSHAITEHKISGKNIIAQSAFWGKDCYDRKTSVFFEDEAESKVFANKQNCIEVLFNEPQIWQTGTTWKEEFEKYLSDMLPIWR